MFNITETSDVIYYLDAEIRCTPAFGRFYHNPVSMYGDTPILCYSSNNILELVRKTIEERIRQSTQTKYYVPCLDCIKLPKAFNMVL